MTVQAIIYITMRSRCTNFHNVLMCFGGAVAATNSGWLRCWKFPPRTVVARNVPLVLFEIFTISTFSTMGMGVTTVMSGIMGY